METTEPTPEDAQQDAQKDAAYELRAKVTRLAVDGFGATRTETPIEGYRILTCTELDPALAGLRAARFLRDVANGEVHEHAVKARGDGASWAEIGRALGIDGPDWADHDAGEVAYRLAGSGHPYWVAPDRRRSRGADEAGRGSRVRLQVRGAEVALRHTPRRRHVALRRSGMFPILLTPI